MPEEKKPEERILLEPRKRSLDQMFEAYEKMERFSSPPDASLRERPSKDPFGLQEQSVPKERWDYAKQVAVRVVKFFVLVSEEFKLGPEDMIFAAELTALNILNAKDVPLRPTVLQAVRDAAAKYYEQSLPAVPEPK